MKIVWKSSCLLFLSTIFLSTAAASESKTLTPKGDNLASIPYLVKLDKWHKVREIIRNARPISLNALTELDQYNNTKQLVNAVKVIKSIKNKAPWLNLQTNDLLKAALFIEMRLPKYLKKNQYYLPRKESRIPYAVEVDPKNHNRFILLDKHVGSGTKKRVTLGLFYDKDKAQIIARGTQKETKERKHLIRRELRISKKMGFSPGVVGSYSVTKKTTGHGNKHHSIFYSFYNKSSLKKVFNSDIKLTLKEKMEIARDILTGMHSLHSKGIAHCDMGERNYLVNISKDPKTNKRVVKACIADLGRADYISRLRKTRVQGHTSLTPPEGLYVSKMKWDDYLRGDVYAAGCVLYHLLNERAAPWRNDKYMKETHRSLKSRYRELVNKIDSSTGNKRRMLQKKIDSGDTLTARQEFEYMIFNMVNPNPYKRKDAAQLKKKIEQICERL